MSIRKMGKEAENVAKIFVGKDAARVVKTFIDPFGGKLLDHNVTITNEYYTALEKHNGEVAKYNQLVELLKEVKGEGDRKTAKQIKSDLKKWLPYLLHNEECLKETAEQIDRGEYD